MKAKSIRILLSEEGYPDVLTPLCRIYSFSELRNGIFTELERIRMVNPSAQIFYENTDVIFTEAFLDRNPDCKPYNGEQVDVRIDGKTFYPSEILSNVAKNIDRDIEFTKDFKPSKAKVIKPVQKIQYVGKKKNLRLHPNAEIYPGVVFDLKDGPVYVSEGVKITSFSFIEGPAVIGRGAMIDNARITGGTIIGTACRIGGEVENSIFGDYSNKHHEGFVGHSLVGKWVNFGALSTTSDLKNNYGNVRLRFGNILTDSGTIKFGSIIGDFTKIAIGTMLNTGTVADLGCNLLNSREGGYIQPFSWGKDEKYQLDRFLHDSEKIMARRKVSMPEKMKKLIQQIYR